MEQYKFLIFYFAIISFISAVVTCYDKIASKNGWYRIPEAGLLMLGFVGGAVSMYIVMHIIRHKTKHELFTIGLPIEILLNIATFLLFSTNKLLFSSIVYDRIIKIISKGVYYAL